MVLTTALPKYSELPVIEATGERHSWGVWGKDDQLGMVNLLTPERVLRATSLVKKGKVFNIEPPRSIPHPGHSKEPAFEHKMSVSKRGRTDYADHWEFHGGMGHLDGLRHIRYREFGYYQGHQDPEMDEHTLLGIDRWAQHGLIGRGVLIDVAGSMERKGTPLHPNTRFPITPELIESIAREQRVSFEPGDFLLLRTGWMRWYLGLSPEERTQTHGTVHNAEGGLECPGLDATRSTAAWLWDNQFCFLMADNIALEVMRIEGSEFQHRRIIALMGMGIGELFTFEELAEDCAADQVYQFMISLKPVNVPGAVGSPASAYVLK
jgi:hypothetical protein